MTNVSKIKLSEKVETSIRKQLIDIFVAQDTYKDHSTLVYELFTPAERTMFAKRIAAIGLLHTGYSTYQVSSLLKLSHVTTARIQHALDLDRYAHIAKTIKRKRGRKIFVDNLVALLTYGKANQQLQKNIREDIKRWKAGM